MRKMNDDDITILDYSDHKNGGDKDDRVLLPPPISMAVTSGGGLLGVSPSVTSSPAAAAAASLARTIAAIKSSPPIMDSVPAPVPPAVSTPSASNSYTFDIRKKMAEMEEIINRKMTPARPTRQPKAYIIICDKENGNAVELPLLDSGALSVETLQIEFTGASGLKYRNPDTGLFRVLPPESGVIYPPPGGWGAHNYIACTPKKAGDRPWEPSYGAAAPVQVQMPSISSAVKSYGLSDFGTNDDFGYDPYAFRDAPAPKRTVGSTYAPPTRGGARGGRGGGGGNAGGYAAGSFAEGRGGGGGNAGGYAAGSFAEDDDGSSYSKPNYAPRGGGSRGGHCGPESTIRYNPYKKSYTNIEDHKPKPQYGYKSSPGFSGPRAAPTGPKPQALVTNLDSTGFETIGRGARGRAAITPEMTPDQIRCISHEAQRCTVCGITLASLQQVEAHFFGKKHKEKCELAGHAPKGGVTREFKSPTVLAQEEEMRKKMLEAKTLAQSTGYEHVGRGPTGKNAISSNMSESQKKALSDTCQLCTVCDITLNTVQQAEIHFRGKKHAEKCGGPPARPPRPQPAADGQPTAKRSYPS